MMQSQLIRPVTDVGPIPNDAIGIAHCRLKRPVLLDGSDADAWTMPVSC